MDLQIKNVNLFETYPGTVLVNIDGEGKGDGMIGNLGRQFKEAYPEAWQVVESNLPFPLPLGKVFMFPTENYLPFNNVIAASTLNHLQDLGLKERENIIYTAQRNAIKESNKHKVSE